jgi:hypothetical protein
MSLHETWRTRKYWGTIGGLLIEEFVAVDGNSEQGRRTIDGIIVLGEKKAVHTGNKFDLKGKDVIVIQTKKGRIGMNLLGQAYFSKLLINKNEPRSIKTVAICGRNDKVMAEFAEEHEVEVIVYTETLKP